ncbi:hypothetical protein [Maridesulfovibrio ferrireducens]|uniref:Uncharacterized protein n=1 Tax=Maridesulfovibrio ferrireducens TaxID=246191 RepID=A0A1G9JRV2_9BACT|nr:hypothetical protein [Maridesulfovibrio ferrireducens]MBI9112460.1 hypothetical protein [Maridesulfovibrio ferrireducens]SDL39663.1 hypothetical protein SAMN05660337_2905 [Maridesulfovibrio ferrireducens]
MGNVLQIRVMAKTYDESQVENAWPFLVAMTWAEPRAEGRPHGVIELVEDLKDKLELGMLSKTEEQTLGESIRKAFNLKLQIEDALGDWKATEANTVSFALEDLLDDLEKKAVKDK